MEKINGTTWWRTGVRMLKGTSRGATKDHYPICGEMKNATNFIFRRLKSSNWGVESICKKQRNLHNERVFKKTENCMQQQICLESLDDYFLKVRHKQESCVERMKHP